VMRHGPRPNSGRPRAARRKPPKRCRMIAVGEPNATSIPSDPGTPRATRETRRPDARPAPFGPGSSGFAPRHPIRGGPTAWTIRSGPPASRTSIAWSRSHQTSSAVVTMRRSPLGICSASSSSSRRPASSSPSPGGPWPVLRSWRCGPRSGPAATSERSTSWWSARGQDEDRVTAVLLDEIIRSAGNKGCSLVEAPLPSDPDTIARWERHGFSQAGPNIERAVKVAGAAGRRS
jgi:hypothetical protein